MSVAALPFRYASGVTLRLHDMKFIVKFNLVLAGAMAVTLVAVGLVAQRQLEDVGRAEALSNARMLLSLANATSTYTTAHVATLLDNQMRYTFLPESVGSFAATEVFDEWRKQHPEYGYREATLNPMNPRDRATDWEADVVSRLRKDPAQDEIIGQRGAGAEEKLYLARRIVVSSPTCLHCHSSAETAPKTVVAKYGASNGYGWQLNETVGAQILTMPAQAYQERARARVWPVLATVAFALVLLAAMANFVLMNNLLRPLVQLADNAERASIGAEGVPEFVLKGNDPVAQLSRSFARMRNSLQKALSLIEA